jgi:hypothetical protein
LTSAQVWSDYDTFGCSVFVQQENFNRVAEVIMIKLVVADAMQPHGCFRGYHEIERRPGWPSVGERWRQPVRRNSSLAHKSHAHKSARSMRLELQEGANLLGCEIINHLFFLNIEPAFATLRRARRRTVKVFANRHPMSNIESSE